MLKQLKEKRNVLIAELETMVTALETETRSLNEDEVAKFDATKKEIENIDATIARVEEVRFNNMDKTEKKVEVEKRSKVEMENRALEMFFKGEYLGSEERALLSTSGTGIATIPVSIAEGILKKLEEHCVILDKAKRFSSQGTLKLLNETTYGSAAITPENTQFHEDDPAIAFIELHSYKITAVTKATFEMLKNSSIDLNSYLTDVIIRRLGKELNKLFLVGEGTTEPSGLINATQEVEVGAEASYDDVIKMITTMHPDFLNGANFIMNRQEFTAYSLLKDGNGHSYVQNGIVNGKFTYTLGGVEIIIDNNMPKGEVLLANIGECYVINLLQDIEVRRLDQIEYTKGVEVFAGYLMADGKIRNQDAVLKAKRTGAIA